MVALIVVVVLALGIAAPAFADPVVDAKLQCQIEFDGGSDQGNACQRGVELASRSPDELQEAMTGCSKAFAEDTVQAGACQRGVGLHTRVAGRVREDDKAGFSYSWKEERAPLTVDVGPYQVLVGDAEKQIDDCKRNYSGLSDARQPSCLSGFTAQQKPEPGSPSHRPIR
jgi:hypothetical protein